MPALATWRDRSDSRPGSPSPPADLERRWSWCPDCERSLLLPAAAPALGTFGAALAFPLLAALAGRWRERAVLAATGYAWLVVAETVVRRDLLFGVSIEPARGWQGSAGAGLTDVLGPLLTQPRTLAAMAGWALGAVIAGAILSPLRSWTSRGPQGEAAPSGFGAPASAAGSAGRQATLS